MLTIVISNRLWALVAFFVMALCMSAGCANAKYDRGVAIESCAGLLQVHGMPLVAQSRQFLCGYACIASVALYYEVTPHELAKGPVQEEFAGRALTAKDLVAMAQGLGLLGFAYEGSMADLSKNLKKGRPIIVLLDKPPRTAKWPSLEWAKDVAEFAMVASHWVVVLGLTEQGELVLHDPRKGRLRMSSTSFEQAWKKRSRVCVLVGIRGN